MKTALWNPLKLFVRIALLHHRACLRFALQPFYYVFSRKFVQEWRINNNFWKIKLAKYFPIKIKITMAFILFVRNGETNVNGIVNVDCMYYVAMPNSQHAMLWWFYVRKTSARDAHNNMWTICWHLLVYTILSKHFPFSSGIQHKIKLFDLATT